jgi:hypothetical protein
MNGPKIVGHVTTNCVLREQVPCNNLRELRPLQIGKNALTCFSHNFQPPGMPTPHVFGSTQELMQELRSARTRAAAELFFAARCETVGHLVREGVAGNTFRAFRNLPVKPSITFRTWAEQYVTQTLHQLRNIATGTDYAAYVHDGALALCERWRVATGSEIGYGRAAKLFNLVLKKAACLQSLTAAERARLISFQHIPLDSYTIVGLRVIAPEQEIPTTATMRFIETPAQYQRLQRRIFDIAAQAEVPPIYYDILAWDMSH